MVMQKNPLLEIHDYGQSIWMDNLTRDLIQSGELQRLIEHRGVRGLTTNPAIFQKAIADNALYDADIEAGVREGRSVQQIYESLIFKDIRDACDLFRNIYETSGGVDGYVSIEVPPTIAHDANATVQEARRYYQEIGRENIMIKIPGTLSGTEAVEQVIHDGISVNVTLLFSVPNYVNAAEAYLRGLEGRVAKGQPIDHIASVASFFLSRIDTRVDEVLHERQTTVGTESLNKSARVTSFMGKVAIANAKVAYQKYREMVESDRWKALADKGAKPQRLLWASTGTKNPAYSDVMYVNELIGQDTVNTLPPATLEACADHCEVENRIETDVDKAYKLFENLQDPELDINLDQIMEEVLTDGIDKFVQPYQSLLESLQKKIDRLVPA